MKLAKLIEVLMALVILSSAGIAFGQEYPNFYEKNSFYDTSYRGLQPEAQQPTYGLQSQPYAGEQTASSKKITGMPVVWDESKAQIPPAVGQRVTVSPVQMSAPQLAALPSFATGQIVDVADRFAKMRIISERFDSKFFSGERIFVTKEGSDMMDMGVEQYFNMAHMSYPGKVREISQITYVVAEEGLTSKIQSLSGNIDPLWPVLPIPGTPLRVTLTLGPVVEIIQYQYQGYEHLVPVGTSGPLVTYLVSIVSPENVILGKYLITWSGDRPMLLLAPPGTPRAN